MSTRIHSILPRIAIGSVLVVPVAGFVLYRSWMRVYEVPRGGDVFTVLRGTWAWSTSDTACRANPLRIAFSADHRSMTITSRHSFKRWNGSVDSIAYYEVLQTTRSSIRAVLRGETRVTADSEPLVWDLVLKSPNTFTWHRTDLAGWLRTPLIRRCPTTLTGVH